MDRNQNPSKPVFVLAQEFGESLAAYRLSRNLRQKDIAELAGISRGAVRRLEAGTGGNFESLVRILVALEIDERLVNLVPNAKVSPLDLPAVRTGSRQRARPKSNECSNEPWEWDD
ncbi:helix-turn-helix domain-containing protein [Cognatishimia activa]|uniref:helix-turn-helix domain-containing protein n=1 Tax=Cognatishimia activa TaxID=1715691 RepID=UPI002230001D|nr:helix-turn-helix transcriptional regulator [Cognatishimia activa]UZD89719.1 helix-turn-helix domain-containing protein [Cognatishimia activa]